MAGSSCVVLIASSAKSLGLFIFGFVLIAYHVLCAAVTRVAYLRRSSVPAAEVGPVTETA